MLRLDFLRDMARDLDPARKPATPAPRRSPEGSGAGKRALGVLLVLMIAGGVALYITRPRLFDFVDFGGKRAAEVARADSLRTQALHMKASRAVDEGLALSIEWLNQLETLPLGDSAWALTLSSFTPPGRFVLKGSARKEETISAVQEALVLFPGADVTESRADRYAAPESGYAFAFSGSVTLSPEDSLPPVDRTIAVDRVDAELTSLRDAATAAGILFATPEPGAAAPGSGLEARAYHLSGTCDSAGLAGIRTLLEGERRRGSPFGVRRLTLENRDGHRAVFLDIMAFTR
ncbi:MAG TPA: hypothetical protein VHO02_03060 [Fibrobacteria bacterium]|jgi:hypothetical protein|nr:hypothetical protein [Fibrobacteria bacterium]